MPREDVAAACDGGPGGLAGLVGRIEADFLHEATRVMSGSKAIADSLSDTQAVMLLQMRQAAESGRAAPGQAGA